MYIALFYKILIPFGIILIIRKWTPNNTKKVLNKMAFVDDINRNIVESLGNKFI